MMVRDPDPKRAITVWLRMTAALRAEGLDDDERAAAPNSYVPCEASDRAAREQFDNDLAAALLKLIDAIPDHQPGQVYYSAQQAAILFGVMIGLAHDGPCTCMEDYAKDIAKSFFAGFGAVVTAFAEAHTRIDA